MNEDDRLSELIELSQETPDLHNAINATRIFIRKARIMKEVARRAGAFLDGFWERGEEPTEEEETAAMRERCQDLREELMQVLFQEMAQLLDERLLPLLKKGMSRSEAMKAVSREVTPGEVEDLLQALAQDDDDGEP
jgi:hypothetical protein